MEKRREPDNKSWMISLIPEVAKIIFAAGLVYGAMTVTQNTSQSEASRYRDIVDVNCKRITILETNYISLEKSFDLMRSENKEAHMVIMRYLERR